MNQRNISIPIPRENNVDEHHYVNDCFPSGALIGERESIKRRFLSDNVAISECMHNQDEGSVILPKNPGVSMETEYDFKAGTYEIAKHEAGHWLCAMGLGWEPRSIHIRVPAQANAHYGYALTSRRQQLKSLEDVKFYAMNRVKVLYSGAYAENYDGKVFDREAIWVDLQQGGGANSDFLKAEEIYFFYYNCLNRPRGWEDEFYPILLDVQLLIMMNYDFISAVAKRMMDLASVPGEEILLTGEELTSIYHSCEVKLASFPPE